MESPTCGPSRTAPRRPAQHTDPDPLLTTPDDRDCHPTPDTGDLREVGARENGPPLSVLSLTRKRHRTPRRTLPGVLGHSSSARSGPSRN